MSNNIIFIFIYQTMYIYTHRIQNNNVRRKHPPLQMFSICCSDLKKCKRLCSNYFRQSDLNEKKNDFYNFKSLNVFPYIFLFAPFTGFSRSNELIIFCQGAVWSKSLISKTTVLWNCISKSNESKQFINVRLWSNIVSNACSESELV